jgi:hypothetical protein
MVLTHDVGFRTRAPVPIHGPTDTDGTASKATNTQRLRHVRVDRGLFQAYMYDLRRGTLP